MPERTGVLEDARRFLVGALRQGPVTAAQLRESSSREGHDWGNVRRAAGQLSLLRDRVRDPVSGRSLARWGLPKGMVEELEAAERTPAAREQLEDPPLAPRTVELPPLAAPRTAIPALAGLERTMAQLSRNGRPVEIFRYEEGELAYVSTIPAGQFSLGWVSRTLGGGRYSVEGHEFRVAGDPRIPEAAATAALAAPRAPVSGVELIMSMYTEQQKLLIEVLRNRAEPANAIKDAMEIVKMIRGEPAPRTSTQEALELVKEAAKLAELRGEGLDDGGDSNPILDRVLSIAERFATRYDASRPGREVVPGQPPQLPAPVGNAEDPLFLAIASILPQLVKYAERGISADTAASWIYEEAPIDDETLDRLTDWGLTPNFVPEVSAFLAPHIGAYGGWFTQLAESVKRYALDVARDTSDTNGAGHRTGSATG